LLALARVTTCSVNHLPLQISSPKLYFVFLALFGHPPHYAVRKFQEIFFKPTLRANIQGDDFMTTISKWFHAGLGLVLTGAFLTAMAGAQCGTPAVKFQKQAWRVGDTAAALTQTADDLDPIVGLWHVTFTAQGNSGGPPDGTPIDNAMVVWHSDGTEIMNSGRPPQDGDFCMGIWKKAGNKYNLNHFAWGGNDTTNAPAGIGNPAGPTRITETVTLSADGNSYTGTFILKATDTSGNTTAHIVGVVSATRVTMDTTVNDLL
jgi:hypothetical protein